MKANQGKRTDIFQNSEKSVNTQKELIGILVLLFLLITTPAGAQLYSHNTSQLQGFQSNQKKCDASFDPRTFSRCSGFVHV